MLQNSPHCYLLGCVDDPGSVLMYIDYILIHSATKEEHVRHVQQVLSTLEKHCMHAQIKKSEFFQTSIEFLGHILDGHTICMDNSKVAAVRYYQRPTTLKELHSFLGLANYYSKFVERYSGVRKSLTDLLASQPDQQSKTGQNRNKNRVIEWGLAQRLSFDALEAALVTAQVLCLYDRKLKPIMVTDACTNEQTIRGSLMQDDGDGR
eukprot:262577-Rhodomonas_salina.2